MVGNSWVAGKGYLKVKNFSTTTVDLVKIRPFCYSYAAYSMANEDGSL